jgi:hypothetical protein
MDIPFKLNFLLGNRIEQWGDKCHVNFGTFVHQNTDKSIYNAKKGKISL